MDEFGDRTVTETLDTGISSPDEIGLEERHAPNTERIDFDEYPWAGRSLGELENTSAVESQNSGKHSSILFSMCVVALRRVDSVSPAGPSPEV